MRTLDSQVTLIANFTADLKDKSRNHAKNEYGNISPLLQSVNGYLQEKGDRKNGGILCLICHCVRFLTLDIGNSPWCRETLDLDSLMKNRAQNMRGLCVVLCLSVYLVP